MNWIFDHFQIVVLVALGVGSMLKSFLESKARKANEQEEEVEYRDLYPPDESYREAPAPSVPPPLTRASVPPPLRERGYDEAVANENAKVLKHQMELAEHLRKIHETRATTTGGAAATRARIAGRATPTSIPQIETSIRSRLRNPVELRHAIVMREILDPPVGLR